MQDENTLREVAKDCVHCGFCLPACPTYQLWAEEMDSPRGRIYLVNQILDGAELTPAAAEHFDRCLGCMACMTACPSGVQYDQLIEAARAWTEEARPALGTEPDGKNGIRDRAARAAIFAVFPYPRRLQAMLKPLRAAQRTGLDRRVARSSLPGRLSPALGAALRLAPPAEARGPAARARGGARAEAGGGRDADRLRPVGVLPAGQRRDRAGARAGGLRRGHPARPGLLRRAVLAFGPGGRGGGLRPAHHRDVRAGRGGHYRGQLGGLRLGHEGIRAAAQ